METPILLNRQTDYEYVDMTLYLQDVKILHNSCVDILNKYPEMIGYKNVMEKLRMVIEEKEKKINKKYNKIIRRKEKDFGFNI
jgi:hypothetical protein